MTEPCVIVRVAALVVSFMVVGASGSGHGAEKPLDELLDMDLVELMEVEVTTASKRKEGLLEAPATVRVVTASQIEERGYATLDEVLGDLPGVQRRDIMGLNSYIFLRGIPNQNNLTLVMVDGVPINELNSGGFYGGGQYNLANVKRIEVVYGPGSALYGTNALAGVVNVITKDPWDEPGLRAHAAYGSFATMGADAAFSHWDPDRRHGLRVAAMVKRSERAELAGAAGDNNWTADLENFEEDIALDAKVVLRDLTLAVNYQNKQVSSATYNKAVGTPYLDHDTLWNIHFLNALAQYEWRVAPSCDLLLRSTYRNATVADDSVREVTDEGRFGFYRPNHLAGLEAMVIWRPLAALDVAGGLVAEWERLSLEYGTSQSDSPDEAPPRPSAPESDDNMLVSGYAQVRYDLAQMFQFDIGGRYDHSTVYGDVLAPRAGLTFHRGSFLTRLTYGEGFRAPKPWDYSDGLGNSSLNPERMRALELSSSWGPLSGLRIGVTGYRNALYDLLVKKTTSEGWRWTNLGRVVVWGVEAEASLRVWRTRSFASYTWTHARDDEGKAVAEIADHMANVGSTFSFDDHVKLEVRAAYGGERETYLAIPATGGTTLDDWIVLSATLSFLDYNGFDVQLIARNVLDAEYYHPSHRSPERYRQAQRSFLLVGGYQF